MTPHAVCKLIPAMKGSQWKRFLEDIDQNGQREPILVREGEIIDGRHRFRACQELRIEPWFKEWDGSDSDLLDYAISANVARRELTPSQKALLAARLATLKVGSNQHKGASLPVDSLPESQASLPVDSLSAKSAADKLGIGRASVFLAKSLLQNGIPELIDLVDDGSLQVKPASMIAALDHAEQRVIALGGLKLIRDTVKALKVGQPIQLPAKPTDADQVTPPVERESEFRLADTATSLPEPATTEPVEAPDDESASLTYMALHSDWLDFLDCWYTETDDPESVTSETIVSGRMPQALGYADRIAKRIAGLLGQDDHLEHRHEFLGRMADGRTDKYLGSFMSFILNWVKDGLGDVAPAEAWRKHWLAAKQTLETED